ncbi:MULTISPECIES: response regulator transcription factor [unclassified Streptomyces]|uniref:response regulator transcription factor n=1 Tax=unclassified Streptomyces TaxID=2593676 RepID=UPI0019D0FBAA|nr:MULTISPECIES: helix-turn-helix transcriptional regulator [unclassified Streptomyces]
MSKPEVVPSLSPHELRIALLVAEGHSNPEVAAQIGVTRRTVEFHLTNIYAKLSVDRRTQLAKALSGMRLLEWE